MRSLPFPLRLVARVAALGALTLVSAAATAAGPAGSGRHPRIEIHAGPPPQQDETPGRRRPGYLWTPGYWTWSGDRFVWRKGRHVRSKADSFQRIPDAGAQADGRYRVYELGPQRGGEGLRRVR